MRESGFIKSNTNEKQKKYLDCRYKHGSPLLDRLHLSGFGRCGTYTPGTSISLVNDRHPGSSRQGNLLRRRN